MASDRQVSARAVLRALAEVRRAGGRGAMERLEQTEPDLAEFVLEGLSLVHQHMLALGGPPRRTRKAYRELESLVLVAIEAVRQGHLELWREQVAGTPLGDIASSLEQAKGPLSPEDDPPPGVAGPA